MTPHDTTPKACGKSLSKSLEISLVAILLSALLAIVAINTLHIFNANYFHEELRILYHLDPARTNAKDYGGQYLGKFPQPILYDVLTKAALGIDVDLIIFHKLLMLACLLLVLAGSALAGWRIGGAAAAAAVPLLVAAQPIYHFQINSATPHAFAFPLLIWGLVCLLYERPFLLAGLTVLSGLLYPPISPVLGLGLAWHLVIASNCMSAQNENRVADVLVLGITGAISVTLLWRQLLPIEGYGASLPPGDKVEIYPENGPAGRHFYAVFHPVAYVMRKTIWQFRQVVPPPIVIMLILFYIAAAGYGLYQLRKRTDIFRPVLSFIVPSLIFCVLVMLLRPYVSYRFVLYPLFVVLPVLFVGGLLKLCETNRAKPRDQAAAIVAVMAMYIVSLNSLDADRNGFTLRLDDPSNRLMEFVRGLPADNLLAAWPSGSQTSLISYVAGRPILLNHKAHYPTYEGYTINLRARMFDLIYAYLASDIEPLIRLHCRWKVDYLVVDRDHFADEETAPDYFAPFNKRIEKILSTAEMSKMILRQPPAGAVVFQAGKFTVLNMALLSDGAVCPAQR
jgi:hypothetical protein